MRDELTRLLSSSYSIPEECRTAVAQAIRQYATKNLSDQVIAAMVGRPLSPLHTFKYLADAADGGITKASYIRWRARLDEWLVCLEYNSLKNKGEVMATIVNPDESSKCDLLHIIRTPQGYLCKAGPDCKAGLPAYVLDQWEKICRTRRNVPLVDVDGWLTDPTQKLTLTPRQQQRLDSLTQEFPQKKPVATQLQAAHRLRAVHDLQEYVISGLLPSQRKSAPAGAILDERPPHTKQAILHMAERRMRTAESIPWHGFRLSHEHATTLASPITDAKAGPVRQPSPPHIPGLRPSRPKADTVVPGGQPLTPHLPGLWPSRPPGDKVVPGGQPITPVPPIVRLLLERGLPMLAQALASMVVQFGVAAYQVSRLGPVAPILGDTPSTKEQPSSRAAPSEHEVPAHQQRYHKAGAIIWKAKQSYTRGSR